MIGYWMNETSGVLRTAVERFLEGDPLTPENIAALRAYLRQWVAGPFLGVDRLRAGVDGLTSRKAIDEWLDEALELNIDPF
jgi:hypothetical protein